MKKGLLVGFTALLSAVLFAANPLPPTGVGVVGSPTNGFWMTNVVFVYTNTAVRTPTIDLGQVTAYSSNVFDKATLLSWTPPTNTAGLAYYRLYYGAVGSTNTNTFQVSSLITSAAFYNAMSTTNLWWAYCKSVDSNYLESVPSSQILFTPR